MASPSPLLSGEEQAGASDFSPFPPLPDANTPFVKRHLGTDWQVGSYILLVFSIEYLLLEIYLTATTGATTTNVTSLIAAILFAGGSVYFIWVSYPSVMMKIFTVSAEEVDKYSCTDKYFTGNHFLLATWLFFFALSMYLYDGIALIIFYPTSLVGYVYSLFCLIVLVFMFIWVYACRPQNLLANDMRGSSVVYDNCLSKCCCCCGPTWKTHLGTDFLVGAWFFEGFFVLASLASLAYVLYAPASALAWAYLTMSLGFTAGFTLFIWSSYPENFMTTVVYDKFLKHACCVKESAAPSASEPSAPPV